MNKFSINLWQAKDIFAVEVNSSNIPFHTSYIAPVEKKILSYFKTIIPNPKKRSHKWISTSLPMHEWDTPLAEYSSAEYYANNLLSPVYFNEGTALIAKEAIVIEIAPHGLFQAILNKSLSLSVVNISLAEREHSDNVQILLQGLGKMYVAGMQPQIGNILQLTIDCLIIIYLLKKVS